MNRFLSWLFTSRFYGPRCPDTDPDCPCCFAWRLHDFYFNGGDDPHETEGFISRVSPEQLKKALEYDGPLS